MIDACARPGRAGGYTTRTRRRRVSQPIDSDVIAEGPGEEIAGRQGISGPIGGPASH